MLQAASSGGPPGFQCVGAFVATVRRTFVPRIASAQNCAVTLRRISDMLLRRAARGQSSKAAPPLQSARQAVRGRPTKLEDLELETAPAPPKGDATALLRVRYSSLNYKDGLVLSGSRGVAKYPVVPGINLVGTVVQDAPFAPPKGSRVACVNGQLGQTADGGYAEFARVPSTDLTLLPDSLDDFAAAAVGRRDLPRCSASCT